jgi:hypothetical protein
MRRGDIVQGAYGKGRVQAMAAAGVVRLTWIDGILKGRDANVPKEFLTCISTEPDVSASSPTPEPAANP